MGLSGPIIFSSKNDMNHNNKNSKTNMIKSNTNYRRNDHDDLVSHPRIHVSRQGERGGIWK